MSYIKEQQENCDNCIYPTTRLKMYKKYDGQEFMLCEICHGTFLGHATLYPNQVSDDRLYKSIAYVVNLLLDEIRETNGK